MAYSYEREKARCAERARELIAEMESAIESGDKERFVAAYQKSFRYTTKAQRKPLQLRFLAGTED